MADYHILAGDKYGNMFTVVFHLPMSVGDNAIGYNYFAALSEWRGSPYQSQIPWNLGGEQVQLDDGELIEHSTAYHTNPMLTPIQERDRLRQIWTELQQDGGSWEESEANIVADHENMLKYWHYEDSLP